MEISPVARYTHPTSSIIKIYFLIFEKKDVVLSSITSKKSRLSAPKKKKFAWLIFHVIKKLVHHVVFI